MANTILNFHFVFFGTLPLIIEIGGSKRCEHFRSKKFLVLFQLFPLRLAPVARVLMLLEKRAGRSRTGPALTQTPRPV